MLDRVAKRVQPSEIEALPRSARYFSGLPDELATELAKLARKVVVRKGGLLHQKGDVGDGLYHVISGSIRIGTINSTGREVVLTDLKPGAFFGEISLFDELPRTHDARANERSELLFAPAAQVRQLIAKRPVLAQHFLRALTAKLRLSFAVIESMGTQTVEERLVLRLVWLAEERHDARSSAPIELGNVSQGDLAAMVGATRQSINKVLQALQRAGVIQIKGRSLTLLDVAALRARAGL